MDAITFNSTAMLRKHFGLVEEGRSVYKKQIDINGNNKFEDDELIDTNENGTIEDKEVWEFLARHVLNQNIQEFIKEEDFIGTVVKDLENLPENSHPEIRALAQEIIYKNFTYDFKPPETGLEPAQEIKLELPDMFSDLLLSLEFGYSGNFDVYPTAYKATLENLPYPTGFDGCCEHYRETNSGNASTAGRGFELNLFLANIFSFLELGIGLGLGYKVDGDDVWDDSEYRLTGPILEARFPLYSTEERELIETFGLYLRYSPPLVDQGIAANKAYGEEYKVGKINSTFRFSAGMIMYGAAGYLAYKFGPYVAFQKFDVEKVDLPEVENNVNIHLEYPQITWGLEFSIAARFSIWGGE